METSATSKPRPVKAFILTRASSLDDLADWAESKGATVRDPGKRQQDSIDLLIFPPSGTTVRVTPRTYAIVYFPDSNRMSAFSKATFTEMFEVEQ